MPQKKKPQNKKQLETLCVLPWIGREVRADGSLSVCCTCDLTLTGKNKKNLDIADLPGKNVFESSPNLLNLKKSFLKGQKPKACRACWRQEDGNVLSRRQKMNQEHKEVLKTIKSDPQNTSLRKSVLDFKMGNICNQKCLICGPAASSLWIQEHRKIYGTDRFFKSKNISDRTVHTLRDFVSESGEIHLSGGEPFLDVAGMEELLSKSIHDGTAKNQSLIITTNGSVFPERLVEDLFPKFKKVQILMSADGTGLHFNYLRFPGKWEIFFDNYKRFKKSGFFAGICITVSALNAYYIPDYLKFWEEQNENKILFNYLNSPEPLALAVLPPSVTQMLAKRWLTARFKIAGFDALMFELFQYLQSLGNEKKADSYNEFRQTIKTHDKYRSVSFENTFSEFGALLG
jgi:hypothetical protein